MSSAVTISRPADEIPLVTLDRWTEWCAEHGVVYAPQCVSGNVGYYGGTDAVEVHYGRSSTQDGTGTWWLPGEVHRVSFSTYYGGEHVRSVADLALAFWQRFGGRLDADPEVAAWFTIADPRG